MLFLKTCVKKTVFTSMADRGDWHKQCITSSRYTSEESFLICPRAYRNSFWYGLFFGNLSIGLFPVLVNSPGIENNRRLSISIEYDCQSSGKHNLRNQIMRLYDKSESSAYSAFGSNPLVGAFPNGRSSFRMRMIRSNPVRSW